MNKIAIYIRTSTDEQNPENQLKDCLNLVTEEYELFEDKQSAWKEHKEREGFDSLKKLIIRGKLRKLVVWDLDRIYRDRKNLVEFFKFCELNKCKIHSYRQKWLTQINNMPSPWNEIIHDLMIQIMGWLAQEESDKKSQRVRASMRMKEDGVYSYKGNKWGRKRISLQATKKILELREKGMSIRQICKEVKYSDKNNNMKNVSSGLVHKIVSENGKKKKVLQGSSQVVN